MLVKDTSVETNFSAEAWSGLHWTERMHKIWTNRDLMVTAGTENIPHSVFRSAHHRGDAFDMRRWYLKERAQEFVDEMHELLGDDWVVILEDNHIHAHWAPTYHNYEDLGL